MFYGLKYFNITLVQSVDPNVINRDKRRADFFLCSLWKVISKLFNLDFNFVTVMRLV